VIALPQPPLTPTPADWLLVWPMAAIAAIWALYLSPAGESVIAWGQPSADMLWKAWGVQLLPLGIGLGAVITWLAANRWDWPNLGVRLAGWRWLAAGGAAGAGLAAVNFFVIMILAPLLFGPGVDYRLLDATPHARLSWWAMLFVVVPLVAVVIELFFRGFLLGRLLVWMPAGALGRWGAIIASALFFAWDPFLVMSFRELHWLGWSDGVVWGYLFVRSGTLAAPIVAHGVEVGLLYAVFHWLVV
jgi:membrane protease YdiL (CAAX protease family)